MRKHFSLCLFLLWALSVSAVERVSLAQLQTDWSQYKNHDVQITDPLVVCGSFYDSLILAPQRLFCPEECAVGLADGDSTVYWQIVESNRAASVVLNCRNAYYKVRTGDVIRGLKARVTSERHLLTGKSVATHHMPMDKLPKPQKDELRVVGANIENYFADLGGYAHKRTTPVQQALKTRKVVKGLRAMKADVFAFFEMQVGDKAPHMLLDALDKKGNTYGFVSLGLSDKDRIGGSFVYNKKRVRPCGEWLSALTDTTSHYYSRILFQGFETLDKDGNGTGQKFIVSLSHFKSKRPGRGNYDTNARRVENADSMLTAIPQAIALYGDSDVLLLGDYNCYTQETPIQNVVRAGYADMLPHGTVNDYSYNYKGESGYLDRCFANPSMASQIIRVRPWHVNTDWYYQHGAYKMKDKSYHRYADHDPIIVDIKLR
ncbi:MAG: hypothetical protein J6T71_00880 [Paludibacteraceae bacterium]|nr:hypothetical protein [Paludibacteraceae bacterium]